MQRGNIFKIAAVVMSGMLFLTAAFFAYQAFFKKSSSLSQKVEKIELEKTAALREVMPPRNDVAAPDDENNNRKLLVSENFKVDQVQFGGDASIIIDDAEKLAIEIGDVYSESFLAKKGEEAKMVISWRTNKLTTSNIEYAKADGQDAKAIREDEYGFTHSAILPNLEPGKAYIFRISSTDRWGNEQVSDYYGAYVSARPVSIFEMIGKTFNDIFGWAIK